MQQEGETWTGFGTWPYANTRGGGLCGQTCVQVSTFGALNILLVLAKCSLQESVDGYIV